MSRFESINTIYHRWMHSYGYGIQSPSVYYYIKYVLNDQSPYYSYDELLNYGNLYNNHEIKLLRLYFRLANFHQPHVWLDLCDVDDSICYYIKAGCHKTKYLSVSKTSLFPNIDIARIVDDNRDNYEQLLRLFSPHSIMIVNHIRDDNHMFSFWNEILADNRTGLTIDMFSTGIVFFDNRPKQNYTIFLR